jgi:hypothetical protein
MKNLLESVRRLVRQPAVEAAPMWEARQQPGSTVYEGFFVARDRSGRIAVKAPGRIVEWPALPTDVYIQRPPAGIRNHRHGSCFQLIDPATEWFKLHWEHPATDFESSVFHMEEILAEALLQK